MASSDIQGFFRQKKKPLGVSKPPAASKRKLPGRSSASLSAHDPVQPPDLVSHGRPDLKEDFSLEEEMLRQFDMDMRYGPCLGIGRRERWDRALRMGLDPPPKVAAVLRSCAARDAVDECLWEGRV